MKERIRKVQELYVVNGIFSVNKYTNKKGTPFPSVIQMIKNTKSISYLLKCLFIYYIYKC